MVQRLRNVSVILTAVLVTLAMTAGTAVASPVFDSLGEVNSANDDMGSTAVETSGATYNADRNVLVTLDDEQNAYEFALNSDGFVDSTVAPRIMDLDFDTDDFEGIAWIEGETYGFLSERSGEVLIATIPAESTNRTSIGMSDVERRFPVISGSWGNLGPEGLATDGDAFYVVREMPATVTKFDFDGSYVASVSISSDLTDSSGIVVLSDDTYLITSHEDRLVAHYDIDWDNEVPTLLDTRSASQFTQLEGIAAANTSDIHLFGEDNTRKGQPGKTYSHLRGALVIVDSHANTISYEISDLDCSGTTSISDAIMVAQISTKVREANSNCGAGDMNGDGRLSIADAILVNRCSVGIPGPGCPAP